MDLNRADRFTVVRDVDCEMNGGSLAENASGKNDDIALLHLFKVA